MIPSLDSERIVVMDEQWLAFLDEVAEQGAIEIIENEGTEPEYLTYSETTEELVDLHDLDDEDAAYIEEELKRLVTTAKVKIKLKRRNRTP